MRTRHARRKLKALEFKRQPIASFHGALEADPGLVGESGDSRGNCAFSLSPLRRHLPPQPSPGLGTIPESRGFQPEASLPFLLLLSLGIPTEPWTLPWLFS